MNPEPTISLVDTHCHLNHPDLAGDLPQVLHRAEESGVVQIICAGFDPESSALAVRLAREIRMVYATVGVHPHDAHTFTPATEEMLRKFASDREHVVALGETGLDYYRNLSPRDVQQKAYRRHIEMAVELDLPLVIHSREAQEDVISILREHGMPPRGAVMHCVPSDPDFAREAVDLGCYLGIAGPITFRNAEQLRMMAKDIPLDHLLLETDAPYLTPHPHRGRRNEPSYLPLIASELASVHGVSQEEVASVTTANARKLFGLD